MGRWLYKIQKGMRKRKVAKMRRMAKNKREETLSRMRFGYTGLNNMLFKWGNRSENCEFCGQEEILEHIMLYCQKYEAERKELIANLIENKLTFKLR